MVALHASLLLLTSPLLAAALRVAPGSCPATYISRAGLHSWARTAPIRLADGDDTPSPEPVLKDASDKMKKSLASVQENLSTLRVGRASPDLLDRVVVNYYDTETPLNQLASITSPTASQLVVDPCAAARMLTLTPTLRHRDSLPSTRVYHGADCIPARGRSARHRVCPVREARRGSPE
jgi:hypothetical protein